MRERRLIDFDISSSYKDLGRNSRKDVLRDCNPILVYGWSDSERERAIAELYKLQNLGYAPISLRFILASILEYGNFLNKPGLPFSEYKTESDFKNLSKKDRKKILSAQTYHITEILGKIKFSKVGNKVRVKCLIDSGEVDITTKAERYLVFTNEELENLFQNKISIGHAINCMQNLLKNDQGFAILLDSPLGRNNGPILSIQNSSPSLGKYIDKSIKPNMNESEHLGVLRELVRYGQIQVRRTAIKDSIRDGELDLMPALRKDNWPVHPLMNHIRQSIAPYLISEIAKSDILCDEQDIRYQTLFRLASYRLEDIFYHGHYLKDLLISNGSFYHWKYIPGINPLEIEQFKVREDLVREVINEQLLIIEARLSRSKLPLRDILIPSGIFAQKEWEVQREGGILFVVNRGLNKRIPVRFESVDSELANSFHNDLHYIHTPRVGMSFGLFLEDEELPFSIIAIDRIDRNYKKNVLISMGYDPDKCIDFTRLYSKPGVPFNASSAIFAQTFQYLRENHPDIQAALSAFMPTYASGLSMVSGGFDKAVILKDGKQYFEAKNVLDRVVWEHVTKRRITGADYIYSQIPMYPTVELFAPIREPRFDPLPETTNKMFNLTTS